MVSFGDKGTSSRNVGRHSTTAWVSLRLPTLLVNLMHTYVAQMLKEYYCTVSSSNTACEKSKNNAMKF